MQLSKDLASNADGYLSQKIEQDLINAVNAMKEEVAQYRPQKWVGIGTSVFRKAKNAQEVRDRVCAATGLDLQIIPQDLEAALGFATAVAASNEAPERVMAWDSGSSSFQITSMINGKMEMYGTEFGYVNSVEALFSLRNIPYSQHAEIGVVSHSEAFGLIEAIKNKLPPPSSWIANSDKRLVAVGGWSMFSIAKESIGHSPFTKEEVLVEIHKLCETPDEKHYIPAFALLYAVMDHCGFEQVEYIRTNGSCEGLTISPQYWSE